MGERTTFVDRHTGRTVWRITDSRRSDKHAYYDLCPWSPDDRYILFSSADPADLTEPGANIHWTQKGQVFVMDTRTFTRTLLAEGTYFQTHQGTFALWSPVKPWVYFQMTPTTLGVVDVDTRKLVRKVESALYWLSPQERIVYAGDASAPEGRGIYSMNEDGSDRKLLASAQAAYEISPYRGRFGLDRVHVGIAKWSPDGKLVLFLMWVSDIGTPSYVSPVGVQPSLFVARADGSRLWCLGYTGHHQSFTPDGRRVLWAGWKHVSPRSRPGAPGGNAENRDPRIFIADIDGSNQRVLLEEPVGGHPTMDPTCRRVVTSDDRGVVLVDVAAGTMERLVVFDPPFDLSHNGTHPHCVWNRDGTQILYNSAQTGNSQLYVVPL